MVAKQKKEIQDLKKQLAFATNLEDVSTLFEDDDSKSDGSSSGENNLSPKSIQKNNSPS